MTHPKPIPEADPEPLTRQELEDIAADLAERVESGETYSYDDDLARALSDLRRLRELLERAPVNCSNATGARLCFPSHRCPACTWNAERKRALGVGR